MQVEGRRALLFLSFGVVFVQSEWTCHEELMRFEGY